MEDISQDWHSWKVNDLPGHLQEQWQLFLICIKGSTPINFKIEDQRMWNRSPGGYTVKKGYNFLLESHTLPPPALIWNRIWSVDSLPKINVFSWMLIHGKILTVNNLQK